MTPELQFQQLANILLRRKRMILAIAASGATLAGVGGLLIPPQYTAKAQIVIEPWSPYLVDKQAAVTQPADDETVQTHVTAISSDDHLLRALVSLSRDPAFRAIPSNVRNETAGTVGNWWRELRALLSSWLTATNPAEGGLLRAASKILSDSTTTKVGALKLEDFKRRLTVLPERTSLVIGVSFKSTSPERAAVAANRIAQLYVESQAEQKRVQDSRALTWLGDRIPEFRNEAARAEAAVQEYRIAHGLADANRTDIVDQELGGLSRQLTAAKADLSGRQARLAYFRDLQHRRSGMAALAQKLDSPVLNDLHHQEVMLLRSEAEVAVTFGERHPKTQQVRSQLQEVRQKIDREIGHQVDLAVENLANEAQIATTQVRSIERELASVQDAGTRIQEAEVRLHELERDAAAARQRYEGLLQRQSDIREQQGLVPPSVRMLSLASLPERPSSPSPILFVPLALMVFVIGGSLLAVVAEQLDRGLRSERDINDALGIPCIGLVPRLRQVGRTRPHQYLLANPYAAYTEAIRSVVAAVELAAPDRVPKVILISSSVPGEGKTTLAVSFAVYAALLGRRVLLIDLDFRHPAVLRELGGKSEIGGVDLLLDGRPPMEAVHHASDLGFDYLPARRRSGDPLRPFACEQMRHLLREMRKNYDCVIVDSPPLLAITEARLLASMVDKVLVVVKWGSTRRDLAQNALNLLRNTSLLDTSRVEVAGAVVTQVDLKKHARYRYGDLGESLARYPKYHA